MSNNLNNLAVLYESQGRYSEALEIAERRLGVNHPNTITIRENLEILQRRRQSWFGRMVAAVFRWLQ